MQNRKSTCKFFFTMVKVPIISDQICKSPAREWGGERGTVPSLTPSLGCGLRDVEEEEENVENVEEGGEHLSQLASPQEQGRATSQSPSPGRVVEITDHGNQKCMYVHWQSLETKPLKSNCLSCLHLFSDVSFPQFVHTLPLSQYISLMFTSANK